MNQQLREHVTSVAFSLALSKNQIDTLLLMYWSGGFNKFRSSFRGKIGGNYCTSAGSLIRRGLFREYDEPCEVCEKHPSCDHRLTRAGVLMACLLAEAGLYEEVLDRYGVES